MDEIENELGSDEELQLTEKAIDMIMDDDLDDLDPAELMIIRYMASREILDKPAPTVAQIEEAVKWMEDVQISVGLLQNILDGNIAVDFDEGNPKFRILPKGEIAARELLDD